ncbi:hypothetical protein Clacol_009399 [Clathrus columnatus]|uniref:Cytochrome P450 n=1 Tax=Clathrus columnatus TaxID=1419009 RepID=A0AAV5APN2_9AGAM|nr:hypothetical protein Clacol_009399 [Clathrus columnatus]
MFSSPFTWLAVAGTIVYLVVSYRSTPAPLPPGPKPKFITGNLHQLPKTERWKTYKEWSNTYGPMYMYRVFGRKVIILNTFKTINDLLDGRSNLYSDRPRSWMYTEIVGRKFSVFSVSSQSPRHKIYRKLLHSGLNARAINGYYNLMEQEVRTLANNLISSPSNFVDHFRQNAGAIILQLAYGWTVTGTRDRFVVLMEEAFLLNSELTAPGKWLVDVFPFLRFVPSWFPGGSFKIKAEEFKRELLAVDKIPFDWAKKEINSGNYIPSFTSQHLLPEDGHKLDVEEEDILKWTSSALYVGGADTTVAFMTAFIAAMTLWPSAQKKARQEVDKIIGARKPLFTDQASMPYISALIKEVLRWAPPAPMGLPHCVTQDEIYSDYFIPKDTIIFANIWGVSREEDIYPNPEEFDPERYLGPSPQMDPRKFVFGFGRRLCPGAAFAEASVFINVTSLLSQFTISKAIDTNGAEIIPNIEFTNTVTSHIKPFPCSIKPRTDKVA